MEPLNLSPEAAVRPALRRVADVADEGSRQVGHVMPAALMVDLQALGAVTRQESEETPVAVRPCRRAAQREGQGQTSEKTGQSGARLQEGVALGELVCVSKAE